MKLDRVRSLIPDWKNVILTAVSAVLLVLAFPPFELWFTAWLALVPLLFAIEREKCVKRSFVLGWLFGNIFFYGTCWWLTFAPITYAGFPAPLAYFLLFCVTSVAALFPALFAAITSFLLRRFGTIGFLTVPFVWVFTEFSRYWVTGNNWNALGYSQAFNASVRFFPGFGGLYLADFAVCFASAACIFPSAAFRNGLISSSGRRIFTTCVGVAYSVWFVVLAFETSVTMPFPSADLIGDESPFLIAVQPNVPMSALSPEKWQGLRRRHIQLAESQLAKVKAISRLSNLERQSTTVVFPESPMNFMYEDDPETKEFINGFAKRNNVSVLFNSAEPDASNGKFFNSAVMVGPDGKEVAQYDKIYLLPFGEAVPFPLEGLLPGFVGNFSYGREYDLLPLGDAKAGVMICFESHFGQLSREYVRNGADAIIEMTNDGYLGPTPVLRQHLANAVFRAVETNRPVLRVTNVGITAYVNERGEVLDAAEPYTEATRVWSVAKSDGSQTFYVKYGDWFAWLSSIVTIGVFLFGLVVRKPVTKPVADARTE